MARMLVPGTTVGLLSTPSKMPSASFGLPAVKACPSAFFGPGAICGEAKDELKCYAMHGAYVWAPVRRAYAARYEYAIRASMDVATGDEFVRIMVQAIEAEACRQERKFYREVSRGDRELTPFVPVFRVHDSGDLFSPAYAALWVRVTLALPDVRFWFPTRRWHTKNQHMIQALVVLNEPTNVAVRPSALRFEDTAPVIDGLSAGTTASVEGFNCPASSQGNECKDCRACWDGSLVISYRKH